MKDETALIFLDIVYKDFNIENRYSYVINPPVRPCSKSFQFCHKLHTKVRSKTGFLRFPRCRAPRAKLDTGFMLTKTNSTQSISSHTREPPRARCTFNIAKVSLRSGRKKGQIIFAKTTHFPPIHPRRLARAQLFCVHSKCFYL